MTPPEEATDAKPTLSRLEWAVVAVATCVVVGFGVNVGLVSWQVGQDAGLTVPSGPDRSLWGMAVMAAVTGGTQSLPPMLPILADKLGGAAGPVQGALLANAIAYGASISLVGATVGMLCRSVWTGAGAAIGATVLAANLITVGPYQWFLQPEMLCMATVLACAFSGLVLARFERWWAALLFGACCAWAFAAKEHGMVVLVVAIPAVFLLVRGNWKKRLGTFALFALGLQLGTNVITQSPFEPFFYNQGTPHGTWVKARVHLQHSANVMAGDVSALEDFPVQDKARLEEAQGAGMTRLMLQQAADRSGPVGPLIGLTGLSLLALLGLRRYRETLALAVGLSPFLAMAVIFVQWRHMMVMWPMAMAGAAAGVTVLADRFLPRVGAGVLLAAGIYGGQMHATEWTHQMGEAIREALVFQNSEKEPVAVARWMRSNAPEGSLLSAPDLLFIITGLRPASIAQKDISLDKPVPYWPHVLWRAYYVGEKRKPGAAWKQVYKYPGGRWTVYRMRRDELAGGKGVDERCLYGILDTSKPMPLMLPDGMERPQPEPASDCPESEAKPAFDPLVDNPREQFRPPGR